MSHRARFHQGFQLLTLMVLLVGCKPSVPVYDVVLEDDRDGYSRVRCMEPL